MLTVLILIVVEERIGCSTSTSRMLFSTLVLILIVVEERIGFKFDGDAIPYLSLNPYCSGRKNRICVTTRETSDGVRVLILIVVEERIGWYGKQK